MEIEFGSVSVHDAASLIHKLFGGEIDRVSDHRIHVRDTPLGDFTSELDVQYAHAEGDESREGFRRNLRKLLGDVSSIIVPCEIVCPPIEFDQLPKLVRLIDTLRDAGASGTAANPFYAFGFQLNPEIASTDAADITAMLKAYVLLSDWLKAVIQIDFTRKITAFADPFPSKYECLVCDPDYWPDVTTLIDDYLAFNPTRNRELDMLPLFSWLNRERVSARIPDPLIKARPTYHYRLPNADINQPDWSLRLEWNRWCVVERLASDLDRLGDMGVAFIANRDKLIPSNWAIRSTEWLLT